MRRYLSALAVALVALSGAARVWSAVPQSTLAVVIGYDLDSTSFVYPIALGPAVSPSTFVRPQAAEGWFERVNSPSGAALDARIKTSSYATAAVSCVTSSAAFSPVSTGDLVQVTDAFHRPVLASILEKTSADAVTLDRSVDLTQTGCATYRYRKLTAGSAIGDGWFSVAGYEYTTVYIDVTQMNASSGLDVQIECMPVQGLSTAQVLASSNITSAAVVAVAIPEPWDMCRVGMKITNTDTDTTSTTIEAISVFAIRR